MAQVLTTPGRQITRGQKWTIAGAALVGVAMGLVLAASRQLTRLAHDRIIAALEEHFESRVELKSRHSIPLSSCGRQRPGAQAQT